MAYESYVVVEANEQYGFARLKAEGSDELLHCELYPDDGEEPGSLQLRKGDQVRGMRRGQSVTRLSWVEKVPPPKEQVERMEEVARALSELGLSELPSKELLAERSWRRARDVGPFELELSERLPAFFSDEAHPFEDPSLLDRLTARMRPHVPDFAVKPVAKEGRLVVEPSKESVVAMPSDREDPQPTFRPLVDHANALLESKGAKVRWYPVRGNWRLGPPPLLALLVRAGLLEGAMLN